jgi:hypothetical protein
VSGDEKSDVVNHPPHYTAHPSGIECIQIVEHMSFNLGNAIKYIWRAGEKDDQLQDLKKAVWYIQREIGRLDDVVDAEIAEDPRCSARWSLYQCVLPKGHAPTLETDGHHYIADEVA